MPVEDRPRERSALEERGRHALEEAAQHEPQEGVRHLRPLLRLWHYPAFAAHASWTVFDPADASGARLVREVRWDRPHDLQRFSDPLEGIRQGFDAPPSLSVRDARVGEATLRPHLKELSRLAIPVVGIAGPFGTDGEVFGLQCYGYFLATRMQWWADGPNAWSAFTAAVARLRDSLAEHFV